MQTVNAIENNKHDPTLFLVFKFATELQITVEQFFYNSILETVSVMVASY